MRAYNYKCFLSDKLITEIYRKIEAIIDEIKGKN